MKLSRLADLALAAAAQDAGFNEHYDFAGEVGPEPVIRLIVQRQILLDAVELVLKKQKFRADSPIMMILTDALTRAREGWPDEPVDDPPPSI